MRIAIALFLSGALVQGARALPGGSMIAPKLSITSVAAQSARITVKLANDSDSPIRIWKESNVWGAAHWRVLRVRDGNVELLYQSPDQAFTRNIPAFEEIPPHGRIEHHLDLNDGQWLSPAKGKVRLVSGETIIVVYDVPKPYAWAGAAVTAEASKQGVWYGTAAACTVVP